jgi:hypothetical protein
MFFTNDSCICYEKKYQKHEEHTPLFSEESCSCESNCSTDRSTVCVTGATAKPAAGTSPTLEDSDFASSGVEPNS